MPILGGTIVSNTLTLDGVAYSFDASNYSHSTIFSASAANDSQFSHLNVAELTTLYTPSTACVDRWVLAGGQTVTTVYTAPEFGITTIRQTVPDVPALATQGAPATSVSRTATTALLPALTTADDGAVFSITPILPRQNTAHKFTILSMALNGTATDPSYRSCQRYSVLPTYSPGVCPSGQTVAEVTAWHVNASTGYRTFWQASCCRSGMTFGSEFYRACISTFSTPVEAVVLLTTSPSSGAAQTLSYEFTKSSWVSSAAAYSTWTVSSTTTLSTGLAVADPAVIAWQDDDLKWFPQEYVTSLANRYEIKLPSETGIVSPQSDSPSQGLTTAAKAGIGVGAALAALVAIVAGVLLWLKRRRRARQTIEPRVAVAEMADQDRDLAKKKWWAGGMWRSEADARVDPQELGSKTVHVVPGPPVELDGAELRHPSETGRVVYPSRDRSPFGSGE